MVTLKKKSLKNCKKTETFLKFSIIIQNLNSSRPLKVKIRSTINYQRLWFPNIGQGWGKGHNINKKKKN